VTSVQSRHRPAGPKRRSPLGEKERGRSGPVPLLRGWHRRSASRQGPGGGPCPATQPPTPGAVAAPRETPGSSAETAPKRRRLSSPRRSNLPQSRLRTDRKMLGPLSIPPAFRLTVLVRSRRSPVRCRPPFVRSIIPLTATREDEPASLSSCSCACASVITPRAHSSYLGPKRPLHTPEAIARKERRLATPIMGLRKKPRGAGLRIIDHHRVPQPKGYARAL